MCICEFSPGPKTRCNMESEFDFSQLAPPPAGMPPTAEQRQKLERRACLWSWFACSLCLLWILVTLYSTTCCINLPHLSDSGAAAMGMLMWMLVGLPGLALPVGVVCLVALVVSRQALNHYSTSTSRGTFLLSLVSPLIALLTYILCWAVFIASDV